jgi:hypothetical protein
METEEERTAIIAFCVPAESLGFILLTWHMRYEETHYAVYLRVAGKAALISTKYLRNIMEIIANMLICSETM